MSKQNFFFKFLKIKNLKKKNLMNIIKLKSCDKLNSSSLQSLFKSIKF